MSSILKAITAIVISSSLFINATLAAKYSIDPKQGGHGLILISERGWDEISMESGEIINFTAVLRYDAKKVQIGENDLQWNIVPKEESSLECESKNFILICKALNANSNTQVSYSANVNGIIFNSNTIQVYVKSSVSKPETQEEGDQMEFPGKRNKMKEKLTDRNTSYFRNLKPNTLLSKAVKFLHERGVLDGKTHFQRLSPIERAEAAKLVVLASGSPLHKAKFKNTFSDINQSDWFGKYAASASILGIMQGFEEGKFAPREKLETAHFLKMLTVAFKLEKNLPYNFSDEEEFKGAWFWEYAGLVDTYELFPSRKGSALNPISLVTREEAVIAIYKILNR